MEMTEIQHIQSTEIPRLLDSLPFDCFHRTEISQEGSLWRFRFECNTPAGRFWASEVGKSPKEAFTAAKIRILQQIQTWHATRFGCQTIPRILLVDDDEDLAFATYHAFDKLGWQADVAVQHEGLHRKIADGEVDYILLDWNLNNAVTADRVFEKALRIISTFSDLRDKFREHKPRIVTYSVLDRDQISLPAEIEKYFEHLDHWQKPMPYSEVMNRAAELMKSHKGER